MNEQERQKNEKIKKMSGNFNILSNDSTDGHGGYGVGTINLNNVTSVFVDPEENHAFVDMGALHARSAVEKRIKFLKEKEAVPNGKLYWLVWVTVEHLEGKPAYTGVGACEMIVDRSIRRGYKSMPEHVNNMDKSMKGKIAVDHMDDKSKQVLRDFLKDFNREFWDHSTQELKQGLNDTE
jgi:hypothetical protein